MILSASVSFKLAKLLKRKKYKNTTPNKLSRPYYNHLGVLNGDMTEYITAYIAKNKKDIRRFTTIDAPTIGEVVDWLFEECGILVSIDIGREFWLFKIKYTDNRKLESTSYELISLLTGLLISNSKILQIKTPNEAYELAISYCLNKLIKNGKKI